MCRQRKNIRKVEEFACEVRKQLENWEKPCTPWFRGDSDVPGQKQLLPRVFSLTAEYDGQSEAAEAENYLVQSFRRKAGGFKNTPPAGRTDLWLFLAQHYSVPTRLLDWTESALNALFFAVNRGNKNPTVYMLNPRLLNCRAYVKLLELAQKSPASFAEMIGAPPLDKEGEPIPDGMSCKKDRAGWEVAIQEQAQILAELCERDTLNYPLTLIGDGDRALGYVNIAPAWQCRRPAGISTPMAFPATCQDTRMIAQRSCFTCHGSSHKPLNEIVGDDPEIIVRFPIDGDCKDNILEDLMLLGTTHGSIFPDLDSVGRDLEAEVKLRFGKIKPFQKLG